MSTVLQLGLFDGRRASIEARFAAYHAKHPEVFAELERRALELLAAGASRIGVKGLVEDIRRLHARRADPGSVAAYDNTLTASYARLLIARHPVLADVIETRTRRGEA